MFIEVTLPHGTAFIRADRIESVMPIAQEETVREGLTQPITMIDMIGSSEEISWWVTEPVCIIMDRVKHQLTMNRMIPC